jgi:hypothetical protein
MIAAVAVLALAAVGIMIQRERAEAQRMMVWG